MWTDVCPSDQEIEQYIDGQLSEQQVPVIERHLASCRACEQRYEELGRSPAVFTQKLKILVSGVPDPIEPLKQLPKVFGAYRLLKRIGEGGMGAVYVAEHLQLHSLVAIKVLKPRFLTDRASRDRFRREIAAAGKVEHPAIVRARDAGEVDGVCFLAMDFVDGIDLSSLIKQVRQIPFPVACEIACRVANGLSAIHACSMVHRDIKPGNLILSRSGNVQILDLGLALHYGELSPDISALTETGQLMGTVDYIAPEQANDTHRVDLRADIYGLGATLFALLAGHPPYGRSNAHLLQKLSKLANEPPIPLSSLVQNLPSPLLAAVEKSLAKQPDDRFQSASEFLEAVQPFGSNAALADYVQRQVHFPTLPEIPLHPLSWGPSPDDTVVLPVDEAGSNQGPMPRTQAPAFEKATCQLQSKQPPRKFRSGPLVLATSTIFGVLLIVVRLFLNRDAGIVAPSPSTKGSREFHEPHLVESGPIHSELARLAEDPSEHQDLWRIFAWSHRPDDRSAILHQAKTVLPVQSLVQRYVSETNSSIKAGLLLAISDYSASPQNLKSNDRFDECLRTDFLSSSDPELHAAIELLLKTQGRNSELQEFNAIARQRSDRSGWYQPLLAPLMVVIDGPQTVRLGSPANEPGRMTNTDLTEDLRMETIDRTFAISNTEISRHLYALLTTNYWENPEDELAELPQNAVTWDDAARFCNLLSAAEGYPPDEFCYEETLVGTRRKMRAKSDALRRRGFRLPTEAEWETACRAGTREPRPFGNEIFWLNKFALGGHTETRFQPVGLLKPNPSGLFDMLGNVSEWTHDRIERPRQQTGHVVRGGSVSSPVEMLRSAGRYYYLDGVKSQKVGFRIAQTVSHPAATVASPRDMNSLSLSVGPPWSPSAENFAPAASEFQAVLPQQTISFGLWQTSQRPQRWFRLTNPGTQAVKLEGVPPLMDGFEYVNRPATEIAPGDSTLFCVRSAPSRRIGTHNCHAPLILSGQSAADPPRLHLVSRFHGPFLEVMHIGSFAQKSAEISVGNLPLGARLGLRFYLRNVGDEPATAEISELLGDLRLASDVSGLISPHRLDQSFRVIVSADHPGPLRGSIKLKSRQAAAQEFQIDVSANAVLNSKISAIGVFRGGVWLVDWNHDGKPEERILFGEPGDQPFTGDFDGDGINDLGVWRRIDPETVQVSLFRRGGQPFPDGIVSKTQLNAHKLQRVIAMDRNADGRSELGYIISYAATPGPSLMWMVDLKNDFCFVEHFQLGKPGDIPFVADWNGDRVDDFASSTPGAGAGTGRLRIEYFWSGLKAQKEAFALSPVDIPLAGDWDGDGDEEIGGWRPPIENQPAIWQFDINGDFEGERDLEDFGAEGDVPFVLRADRPPQQQ